ncbi:Uncharacterized protein SCF082_LOCUS626 [Durusdinium trenchii]|uniref:Uncharacterized protein n=1 Tax=Durusdinium trenchii TaxID=1381693 RepID=A0ABP0H9N6_9DINO
MGGASKSFARKGPGGKGEAKGSEKYVKRVDLFKYLARWALRSYPDSQGRPLMTQGADAASTFEADKLRGVLDADFCELLRRPCTGVNLAAASLDGAMLFAPKLQALMDDLVAVLEKEALAEPVRYMNLCRDVEWGSQESLDASKRLLKQVRATLREHQSLLAQAAEASASVYLGTMALLELGSLALDVKAWGKGIAEIEKQPKAIRAWAQKTADEQRLCRALAQYIKEDLKKNPNRRHDFGDLADGDSDTSGIDSSQEAATSLSAASFAVEGASSSSPKRRRGKGHASKKKKAKKEKKSKQEKTAKAKKPAPKPRGQSKDKTSSRKTGKAAKQSSSDKGEEESHGSSSMRSAPSSPFEAKAVEQMSTAEGAILEVDQKLAFAKALPEEIQKLVWSRAGLLPTTTDDAVLRANAARLMEHTTTVVREARLAWVDAAVRDDAVKANIALLPPADFLARAQVECMPESVRADWSRVLKGDDSADLVALRAQLFHNMWSLDAAVEKYEKGLSFGEKYAKKEPGRDAVQSFLSLFDLEQRQAFGLPAKKTSMWRDACSAAYTLAQTGILWSSGLGEAWTRLRGTGPAGLSAHTAA